MVAKQRCGVWGGDRRAIKANVLVGAHLDRRGVHQLPVDRDPTFGDKALGLAARRNPSASHYFCDALGFIW